MTINITFPAGDTRAAQLFGTALLQYAGCLDVPELGAEDAPEPQTKEPAPVPPPADGQADDTPVDTKGVPFHPDFCSTAEKPFQSSGAQAGQWKKKRGVAQELYDDWYADELAKLDGGDDDESPDVDTGSAFGGQSATPPPPPVEEVKNRFAGFPDFITWFSERQAAGLNGEADVEEARNAIGATMADLFAPSTPDQIADRLERMAQHIESKAQQ